MFLALFQQLHKRLVVCCLSLRFDLHLTHLTSTCCTRFYVSVIVYVYPCVSMCIGSQRGIRGIGQSYHYAKCKHANSLFICLNYVFSCTFCILFFAYWFVFVLFYVILSSIVLLEVLTIKRPWRATDNGRHWRHQRRSAAYVPTQVCHPSFEVTRCWCLVTISWPWKSCPPESSRKKRRKGVELFFWFKAVWF